MSKAADMAKVSAKGGFHLLWGMVISTVISSVGIIFIARLLGSNLYGLYTIALTVPILISTFRDWGVNQAMIRYAAQYRAENKETEIRSIFASGIIFEIALGMVLTFVCFGLSNFIAADVFNRPEISTLIQIASLSILAGGLINAATAVFTGLETMQTNSVMLVLQSTSKTALTIALIILGMGTAGATIGFSVSTVFAGLIGIIFIWTIYRKLPKPKPHKLQIKAYIKTMLQYGVPLSVSTIINGLLIQFYSFLLPVYYQTDNTMIGNYGVALNFVVLIGFFATPITIMLFPAFSKLDHQKDKETLRNVFQISVKYASILVVPVTALVMCLSEPAVSTLFGRTYDSAPLLLSLIAMDYLYTAVGNLSLGNLINSQGQTQYMLKLTLLNAAIGFPVGYTMIMQFGVLGLIVAATTIHVPSMILGLHFIKKHYGVTIDWQASAKILLSSAATAAATYIITAQLNLPSWIRLTIGVITFVLILTPIVIFTKTLTRTDISNLRGMVTELGPVKKLFSIFLIIIEKLMTALKQ